MRVLLLLLPMIIAGCAVSRERGVPSRSTLQSLLVGQRCIATEPGLEDCTPWLDRESEIRYELGRWLPNNEASLLVTVEILDACHAEGFVHHLVTVVDPKDHKLLTPVFHLVADRAQRRILRGDKQDVLIYDAHKDRSFVDVSRILRFRSGAIDAIPVLGTRDPESFDFSLSGNRFRIKEFEWRGDYSRGERHRYVTKSIPVRWNPSTLELTASKTKQNLSGQDSNRKAHDPGEPGARR